MNRFANLIALLLGFLIFFSPHLTAQLAEDGKQSQEQNVVDLGVEMLRKDAKFYVVVVSLLIIFSLIVAYLFFLDKKIGKLEKSKDQK